MNYWRHGILSLSLIREILFPSVKSVVEEPRFPPKALDIGIPADRLVGSDARRGVQDVTEVF
jgi:hypothetical protein